MKISFHPSVMVMFTLLLILTACNKDDDVTPQLPVETDPPIAPIARAGNDTTIYTPFSTHILDGGASTDPDNNIVAYQWKFLDGPSTVYVNRHERNKAFVNGMIKVGNYEFELTVLDADRLSSKDTIVLTIAEPNCTSTNKELIIKDQRWVFPWYMEIQIYDIHSYLPANSYIRNIYIKRDSSDEWETVMPVYNLYQDTNGLHSWYFSNRLLSIYPHHNMEEDTPDIKIEYCE